MGKVDSATSLLSKYQDTKDVDLRIRIYSKFVGEICNMECDELKELEAVANKLYKRIPFINQIGKKYKEKNCEEKKGQ